MGATVWCRWRDEEPEPEKNVLMVSKFHTCVGLSWINPKFYWRWIWQKQGWAKLNVEAKASQGEDTGLCVWCNLELIL